jgi:hypothetical protein
MGEACVIGFVETRCIASPAHVSIASIFREDKRRSIILHVKIEAMETSIENLLPLSIFSYFLIGFFTNLRKIPSIFQRLCPNLLKSEHNLRKPPSGFLRYLQSILRKPSIVYRQLKVSAR